MFTNLKVASLFWSREAISMIKTIDTTLPEDRLYESDGAVLSPWGGYFFPHSCIRYEGSKKY